MDNFYSLGFRPALFHTSRRTLHPDWRHLWRVLSCRREAEGGVREGNPGALVQGPIHAGDRREPEPAATRLRRASIGAGGYSLRGLEGQSRGRIPSSRTKIRLVGAAYPNFIHLVAREETNIRSLRDLIGKRVSVGAARSGNELNARALLGAAGLSYADLLQVEYLRYGESVELFVKGELDAIIVSAGLGVAAVLEASQRTPVRFVPIEREFVEANAKMFFPVDIPAGSYPTQTSAIPTAALNNFFVTTADASEEIVYRITKAIFENLESIRDVHPAAKVISLETALAIRPIDVHPGALRYFR